MKKSSAWKMACIVFMFCAAAVIASPLLPIRARIKDLNTNVSNDNR